MLIKKMLLKNTKNKKARYYKENIKKENKYLTTLYNRLDNRYVKI